MIQKENPKIFQIQYRIYSCFFKLIDFNEMLKKLSLFLAIPLYSSISIFAAEESGAVHPKERHVLVIKKQTLSDIGGSIPKKSTIPKPKIKQNNKPPMQALETIQKTKPEKVSPGHLGSQLNNISIPLPITNKMQKPSKEYNLPRKTIPFPSSGPSSWEISEDKPRTKDYGTPMRAIPGYQPSSSTELSEEEEKKENFYSMYDFHEILPSDNWIEYLGFSLNEPQQQLVMEHHPSLPVGQLPQAPSNMMTIDLTESNTPVGLIELDTFSGGGGEKPFASRKRKEDFTNKQSPKKRRGSPLETHIPFFELLSLDDPGETLASLMQNSSSKHDATNDYQNMLFIRLYKDHQLQLESNQIEAIISVQMKTHKDVASYSILRLFGVHTLFQNYEETRRKGWADRKRYLSQIQVELKNRAANKDPLALYCLSEIEQDPILAEEFLNQSANLREGRAQYRLARNLINGRGVFYDELSLQWMKDSGTQGFGDATLESWQSPFVQEVKDGWIWMKELADQGNIQSQFDMGSFYECYCNFPEASKCYQRAAAQGHEASKNRLIHNGFRAFCDLFYANPVSAYNAISAQNSLKDLYSLGNLFLQGNLNYNSFYCTVKPNKFIAKHWFKIMENYYDSTPLYLPFMKDIWHSLGEIDNSKEYYQRAAEAGLTKSIKILEQAYTNGNQELNILQDDEKSFYYTCLGMKSSLNNIEDRRYFMSLFARNFFVKPAFQDLLINKKSTPALGPQIKEDIELAQDYSQDMEHFIGAHAYYFDLFKDDPSRMENIFLYQKSDVVLQNTHKILESAKRVQAYCAISQQVETPGFFIDCLQPKTDRIRAWFDTTAFAILKKTKWLFFPQFHKPPSSFPPHLQSVGGVGDELIGISSLLNVQQKFNNYILNIIENDSIYNMLINNWEAALQLMKVSDHQSEAEHIKGIIQPILNKDRVEQEGGRKFILELLKERKESLENHILFFEQAQKILPKLISDTQEYRNILFVNANFY